MQTIRLEKVAIAKDGGSKMFVDGNGKPYWQCFSIGGEDRGVLFEGIPPNKEKKAVGNFVLLERTLVQQS